MVKKTATLEKAAKRILNMTEDELTERTQLIIKELAKPERRRKKAPT